MKMIITALMWGVQLLAVLCSTANALVAGMLPKSVDNLEILRIAASIAEEVLVDLREDAFRLDVAGAVLAARAVLHAAGQADLVLRRDTR
jgi:hypothetical protein